MGGRWVVASLAGTALLVACSGTTGSGRVTTETRTVSECSAVELSSVGQLTLGAKSVEPTKPIVYRLAMKSLSRLTVSGAGEVLSTDITTPRLEVTVSGSGMLTYVGKPSVTKEVTGSGEIVNR